MSSLSYSSADEHRDAEMEDLGRLLDAFGSMFSLEDISSAYWESNKDAALTGELLFTRLNSHASDEVELQSPISLSLELPSKSNASNSTLPEQANDTSVVSNNTKRGKKLSASSGLVAGTIGKEYARSELSVRPTEPTKPIKVDLTDFLVSDEGPGNEHKDKGVNKEMEDFLFQMLGSGFQFDMSVIREVLGHCGYDVKMGMEKLLDLSASTLEKSDDIIGASASTINWSRQIDTECSLARKSHSEGVSSKASSRTESLTRKNNLHGVEKEVLFALFSASSRDDKEPEHIPLSRRKPRSRSGAFGTAVTGRPEIVNNFRTTVTMEPKFTNGDTEDCEESYEVLRQAVKEYWVTMKEYYKAAFEAFSNGDLIRANKLMEQGHFFSNKAKEADAKSAEMLFKARDEVMSLDLRDYTPTEAKRLIRTHLTTVCGISSIEYLKLRIGTEAEDKKRARRKKMVKALLEAESIEWTEEKNGEIISIRVDGINPQQLSFVKTK